MEPTGNHIEPAHLEQYLAGELFGGPRKEVEKHLADCEVCLYAARRSMPRQGFRIREGCATLVRRRNEAESEAFLRAFEMTFRQGATWTYILRLEWQLAPRLLEEILRRPAAERRELIRRSPRYQLLGLAEYLREESRKAGFRDVVLANELAELGVEVADLLDPLLYSAPLLGGQRAVARAFLGNARRVASDLFAADRAFEEARALFAQPQIESLPDHAELLSLLASLRIDQGRYAEARDQLRLALAFQRLLKGNAIERAKLRLNLANAYGYAGEPERAVILCRQAARLVRDVEGADRLSLMIEHAYAYWLLDAGDPWRALTAFHQNRDLAAKEGKDPWARLRDRWLEGRILAGLGDLEASRRTLEEVRQLAAQRELAYEHAAVGLDLAMVLLRENNLPALRELAASMVPIFESRQLHHHLLAALTLFCHAAREQTLGAEFLERLQRYVREAKNNPYSRFAG